VPLLLFCKQGSGFINQGCSMRQFWIAFTGAWCLLVSGFVFAFTNDERVNISGLENKGTLSVRSCAGTSCPVLTRLPNDAKGTIISVGDFKDGYSWYQIQWDAGTTGWSVGNYLTLHGVDKPTPLATNAITTNGACQVRLTNPNARIASPYQGECLNGLAHGKGTVVLTAEGILDQDTYTGMFAAGYGFGQMRVVRDGTTLLYEGIVQNWAMYTGTEYLYGIESTRRITYQNGTKISDITSDRAKYEAVTSAYRRTQEDKRSAHRELASKQLIAQLEENSRQTIARLDRESQETMARLDRESKERQAQFDLDDQRRRAASNAQLQTERLERERQGIGSRQQAVVSQGLSYGYDPRQHQNQYDARQHQYDPKQHQTQSQSNSQKGVVSQGQQYQYDPRQHQNQAQPAITQPSITALPLYGNNGPTIGTSQAVVTNSAPTALPPPVNNSVVVNSGASKPSAGTGTMVPLVGTGANVTSLPPPSAGTTYGSQIVSGLPPPISNNVPANSSSPTNSTLTYDKVLTTSEMAWSNSLPYSQRATTQFSPAQIAQIKTEGRWSAWVAQANAAAAKPAQPVSNTQNVAVVGLTDTDRRWISGLPPTLQSQINNINPAQISHLKASGNWERLKTATSQAAAEMQNAEAEEIQGKIQIWTKAWSNFQTTLEVGSLFLGAGEIVEFRKIYQGARLASQSLKLEKYITNANDLHHIFDYPKHFMQPLVSQYGSQEAAYRAIYVEAQKLINIPSSTLNKGIWINVGGKMVWIEGQVVDGIVRVSTASMATR
jgi:hypothetical protein